jgi:16S rRNA processing protein RimM
MSRPGAPDASGPAATDSDDGAGFVAVGHVVRPHGLNGELVLDYYADSRQWLEGPLWLRAREGGPVAPARVSGARTLRGRLLARLEGVADRDAAERLRGMILLMPAGELPASAEGEPYLHELPGMDVLLHASGEKLGVLARVDPAGQELWIITGVRGNEILLPAVPEFVNSIDARRGVIRVSPPPCLLELYE